MRKKNEGEVLVVHERLSKSDAPGVDELLSKPLYVCSINSYQSTPAELGFAV
jgi:hypothetical protein